MSTGLARVTISAPQRRMDLALPEHLPLADLLPEVLRHAGEGLADDGERHGGWVLRRADGAALAAGQPLHPQGVRDGEVLHLVPARAQWPELEYDDVVEAIADGARRRGGAWSAPATRTVSLVAAGLALAIGLAALLRGGPGWHLGAVAALGTAALLTLAGVVASRAYGDAPAGTALGGYALGYAFCGGAQLVATGDPVGVLAPVRWIGAPEALAGAVAVLLTAVLATVGVAAGRPVPVAGVLAGGFGAATALLGFVLPAAGAAAVLMSVLVCGIGALPLLAIRFGRLPMPAIAVPTGTGAPEHLSEHPPEGAVAGGPDGARHRPARGRVHAAVARTEEILTGLLIGHAVLAGLAGLLLVTAGGVAGQLLAAVAGIALLLRSRIFAARAQRIPLLAAGLALGALLGLAWTGRLGAAGLMTLAAAALITALATVATGARYANRPPGPYLGRAAEVLDVLMVVSVVPVACAVLGLYGRARGLLG
ncbi:type VII secretion integral membrane protein EccD [Solwaraspora sp. WMMD1047]|uniref:type VII secretion integral membrane protein EccD n=1 Tax=Solwaraspora sp. WMMD1047 TaxID=3016102 RepID=UPI002416D096|nr:type VII secretion integral membrane protein EccD [Solwaraspora sp. WMMD1047]MDG4828035.1 type VII secretion integral membrane protein EccD [Solwaraspora sp. WMMD1047]